MPLRLLSADDIFISYSRKDAATYALGLADALMKEGFSCFLDRLGTESAQSLPASLIKKLKDCVMLVVVGTPGACQSESISLEISEFSRVNGTSRIVPLDFGCLANSARWQPQIVGIPVESETLEALVDGNPSRSVIRRIDKAFNYARSKQRLRRYATLAAMLLTGSIIVSLTAFLYAREQFAQARTAREEVRTQRLIADSERTRADAERESAAMARREADERAGLALEAEDKRRRAETATVAAEAKTTLAEAHEREATASAERQEKIGTSLRLASQSESRSSEQLDLALLLSAEAVEVSDTYEARNALLRGLQYSPRLLGQITSGLRDLSFRDSEDLILSPDEKMLALKSQGGLKLWDMATGQERLSISDAKPMEFAFCGDGQKLALGFYGALVMLEVATKYVTYELKLRQAPIFGVTCDSSGRFMAFNFDYGGPLYLVDLSHRGAPVELENSSLSSANSGKSLAFSPDSKLLASYARGGKTLMVWDVETRKLQNGWPTVDADFLPGDNHLAFSPDGKTIFSASQRSHRILAWDVAGKKLLQPFDLDGPVSCLAVSPVGDLIAFGTDYGGIRLWDIAKRMEVERLSAGRSTIVNKLIFTSRSQKLVALADEVLVWDLSNDQHLGQALNMPKRDVLSLAFSPDGRYVASADAGGPPLTLREASTAKPLGWPNLPPASAVGKMSFSGNGKLAMVVSEAADAEIVVQLWDVDHGRLVNVPYRAGHQSIGRIALSPDGKLLVVDGGYFLTCWDTATGRQRGGAIKLADTKASPDEKLITHITFSADSRQLAYGLSDGNIHLVDLRVFQQMGAMSVKAANQLGSPNAFAFSPDGKLLASNSASTTKIILWDVDSRQPIGELSYPGFNTLVTALAFSNDGRVLATTGWLKGNLINGGGSNGYPITLWDVAARQPLGLPLKGHSEQVSYLAFKPNCAGCSDNNVLVSGDEYGTVMLWDVSVASWQRRACSIANRRLSNDEKNAYLLTSTRRDPCSNSLPFDALISPPSVPGRRVLAPPAGVTEAGAGQDVENAGELQTRLLGYVPARRGGVTPASRFVEDLWFTDDEWAELVAILKDFFNVDISIADAKKLVRVKDMTSYVEQRLKTSGERE